MKMSERKEDVKDVEVDLFIIATASLREEIAKDLEVEDPENDTED